ncbi:MAG: flippase-like domain-containing protein [Phycisphaerales bacterium]|nr:flippase-like domain-containing protein [Phycisphaerales bacterium]
MNRGIEPEENAAPIRAARLRTTVQVIGFAVGLALLGWCIQTALRPENIEQWKRLREASAWQVAQLLGLALATLLVNGETFRCAIDPVKRLRGSDLQAINATASLLAYLPFKLSLLYRVVIHSRRDGLALLSIGAWFGSIAVVLAATLLPPLGASVLCGRAGTLWWALSLGGVLIATAVVLAGSRLLRDGRGWAWFERLWRGARLPEGPLPRVHEGLRMLSDGRAVVSGVLFRIVDMAIHTARFTVAAGILGFELPMDKAVIAGCSYFMIGTAAPSGSLGLREALTGGLLGRLLQGIDPNQFMVAVLLVTLAELIVLIPAAVVGAVWTRPWNLRAARGGA